MRLRLLTAAFPRLTLEKTAAWASASGFEMLEVACWPAGGDERRYAGVAPHIDVERLDPGRCATCSTARAGDLVARLLPEQPTPGRASAGPRTRIYER